MSSTNVGIGDTVKIDVLVPGGGAGLFPKSILINAANVALGVSPLNLSSVAGDLYSATFVMPLTTKVTATTIIYTDAPRTIVDTNYEPTIDEYVTASAVDNLAIADAVWDEAKSSHVAAGSFGLELNTTQAEHDATQSAIAALNNLSQAGVQAAMTAQGYTTARAAFLNNLDDQISDVMAAISALEISIKGADDRDLTEIAGAGFATATHSLVQIRSALSNVVLNIQNLGTPDLVGEIDDSGELTGIVVDIEQLTGELQDC